MMPHSQVFANWAVKIPNELNDRFITDESWAIYIDVRGMYQHLQRGAK